MSYDFVADVLKMRKLYKRDVQHTPHLYADAEQRMRNFKEIIGDEFSELDEVILTQKMGMTLEALVGMADWLGDVIVYCTGEMQQYGLPVDEVLRIIMESNFSKLGADGQPIIDEKTGKFLKGPNYQSPEPKLRQLILYYWSKNV